MFVAVIDRRHHQYPSIFQHVVSGRRRRDVVTSPAFDDGKWKPFVSPEQAMFAKINEPVLISKDTVGFTLIAGAARS